MVVCHTAIVSNRKGAGYCEFISESDDELTFLMAAKQFGFRFLRREGAFIYIKMIEEEISFQLIGLLPFDSERKIMSVVVKSDSGEHILFSKGADSSMLKLITATPH